MSNVPNVLNIPSLKYFFLTEISISFILTCIINYRDLHNVSSRTQMQNNKGYTKPSNPFSFFLAKLRPPCDFWAISVICTPHVESIWLQINGPGMQQAKVQYKVNLQTSPVTKVCF